jgi:DNA invertase Pin-like site-specific DNA recombinase
MAGVSMEPTGSAGPRRLRVAIAARVSTKDRDQDPETQLRPLREHVAGLEGAELLGEFVDKASADDMRGRKHWRRLLELARRRQVDLILVWRVDRAFRSVLDGAQTLASLRSWGCGLRSLHEPWIDTTTPMGEALFHITVVWAQLERQTIAERVRAGMDRARAEGKHVGRPRRTTPITDHRQWPRVVAALEEGLLTKAEAARRLHVRRSTLDQALASWHHLEIRRQDAD